MFTGSWEFVGEGKFSECISINSDDCKSFEFVKREGDGASLYVDFNLGEKLKNVKRVCIICSAQFVEIYAEKNKYVGTVRGEEIFNKELLKYDLTVEAGEVGFRLFFKMLLQSGRCVFEQFCVYGEVEKIQINELKEEVKEIKEPKNQDDLSRLNERVDYLYERMEIIEKKLDMVLKKIFK